MLLVRVVWLMLALALPVVPAWAWLEELPGSPRWPAIPGNAGMSAFLGRWLPQCNNWGWQHVGAIFFEPQGRIRYQIKSIDFQTQFRVIETTPYKVTILVHTPEYGKYTESNWWWVLRYLNENWYTSIGVNTCYEDSSWLEGRWGAGDEELRRFWTEASLCNPERTVRTPRRVDDARHVNWGDYWNQECDLGRSD